MREPIEKAVEAAEKVRAEGNAYVIPSNLFDAARGEAFTLTEKDTFRRFKFSTAFSELLKQIRLVVGSYYRPIIVIVRPNSSTLFEDARKMRAETL